MLMKISAMLEEWCEVMNNDRDKIQLFLKSQGVYFAIHKTFFVLSYDLFFKPQVSGFRGQALEGFVNLRLENILI